MHIQRGDESQNLLGMLFYAVLFTTGVQRAEEGMMMPMEY
jgi:hypothetical protein